MIDRLIDRLTEGRIRLLIVLAGIVLFVPFLGVVHLFDWDEINFAEAAREMIVTGDYTRVRIDYQPFWEKPPLFIWTQVASMRLFGVNEFAARFPNAVVGIVTLLVVYGIGRRVVDRRFGLLWAMVYAGSLLPAFYFRSGIIDPLFNLAIFLAVYWLFRHQETASREAGGGWRPVLLAGVFAGLAVLTKGPVGYLLVVVSWGACWLVRREAVRFPLVPGLVFTAVAAAVAGSWFGLELALHGTWFVANFVAYQFRLLTTGEAGHGQPVYYHPVILFLGCFPASAIMFAGLGRRASDSRGQRELKLWMVILLCVVVVVFSAVKTKIVHYSSLAYFPITFLAAGALHQAVVRGEPWRRHATALVALLGVMWGVVLAGLPLLMMLKGRWIGLVRDPFARGNLEAPVAWTGWDALPGVLLLVGVAAAVARFRRGRPRSAIAWLFGTTTVVFMAVLPVFTPRIETITQRAVVEFYQGLAGRQCYVRALGFKTYAAYFYAAQRPDQAPSSRGMSSDEFARWLLEGDIDRPVYFVCKVGDTGNQARLADCAEIGRRNGFVFYRRDPGGEHRSAPGGAGASAPASASSRSAGGAP